MRLAGAVYDDPDRMAVFDPAGDGRCLSRSRTGSNTPPAPQLSVPGTEKELSTRVIPVTVINPVDVLSVVPGAPLIGLLGGGGSVVPVVRWRRIGLAGSPMVQSGPRRPVGVLTRTSMGRVSPGALLVEESAQVDRRKPRPTGA